MNNETTETKKERERLSFFISIQLTIGDVISHCRARLACKVVHPYLVHLAQHLALCSSVLCLTRSPLRWDGNLTSSAAHLWSGLLGRVHLTLRKKTNKKQCRERAKINHKQNILIVKANKLNKQIEKLKNQNCVYSCVSVYTL